MAAIAFDLPRVLRGLRATYAPFVKTAAQLDELVASADAFFNARPPAGRPFYVCLLEALLLQAQAAPPADSGAADIFPLLAVLSGQVDLLDTQKTVAAPTPGVAPEKAEATASNTAGRHFQQEPSVHDLEEEPPSSEYPPSSPSSDDRSPFSSSEDAPLDFSPAQTTPTPKGQVIQLLASTAEGFAFSPGYQEGRITSQARIVKLDAFPGKSVLLVNIAGRDLSVYSVS